MLSSLVELEDTDAIALAPHSGSQPGDQDVEMAGDDDSGTAAVSTTANSSGLATGGSDPDATMDDDADYDFSADFTPV